jgi:CarD family transcriptional regulator
VRDLFRSESQPEQSYSERQLYEAALDRMVRELSAVEDITETEAGKLVESNLMKAPTRNKAKSENTDEQEAAA